MCKRVILVDKVTSIIGKTFGTLTVKSKGECVVTEHKKSERHEYKAHCVCSCGAELDIYVSQLTRLSNQSFCGDFSKHPEHSTSRNLTNEVFGKLKVLQHNAGDKLIHCVCECGKEVYVLKNNLLTGKSLSCGDPKHRIKRNDLYLDSLYRRILSIAHATKRPIGSMFSNFETFSEWSKQSGYSNEKRFLNLKSYLTGYVEGNMIWENKSHRPEDAKIFFRAKNQSSIVLRSKYTIKGKTLKQYCYDNNMNYGAIAERIRNYIRRHGVITEEKMLALIEQPVRSGVTSTSYQYTSRLGMSSSEFARIHHFPVEVVREVMKDQSLSVEEIVEEVSKIIDLRKQTKTTSRKHASKYSDVLGESLKKFCEHNAISYLRVIGRLRSNKSRSIFEVLRDCGYLGEFPET